MSEHPPLSAREINQLVANLIHWQGAAAGVLMLIQPDGERMEMCYGFNEEMDDNDKTPDWIAARLRKAADNMEGGGGVPIGPGEHHLTAQPRPPDKQP